MTERTSPSPRYYYTLPDPSLLPSQPSTEEENASRNNQQPEHYEDESIVYPGAERVHGPSYQPTNDNDTIIIGDGNSTVMVVARPVVRHASIMDEEQQPEEEEEDEDNEEQEQKLQEDPEEQDTNSNRLRRRKKQKRVTFLLLLSLVTVLAIAVVWIVVGSGNRGGNDNNGSSTASNNDQSGGDDNIDVVTPSPTTIEPNPSTTMTPTATMSPTTATMSPTTATMSPTTTFAPSVDVPALESSFVELIQINSPFTVLNNSSTDPEQPPSAPRQALDWMLQQDLSYSSSLSVDQDDGPQILQRFALVTLWYSTGGSTSWDDTNREAWLQEGVHECDWGERMQGGTVTTDGKEDIECNDENFVQVIHLATDGLAGTIPMEVGTLLTSLTFLDLSKNDITGTIPTEVGLLTSLVRVDVWRNDLQGTLPTELGLLTRLTYLSVPENNLEGTLPTDALARLTNLREVWFYSNPNLSGTFPSSLCPGDDEEQTGDFSSLLLKTASIDCNGGIQCDCCVGPWPSHEPCA